MNWDIQKGTDFALQTFMHLNIKLENSNIILHYKQISFMKLKDIINKFVGHLVTVPLLFILFSALTRKSFTTIG